MSKKKIAKKITKKRKKYKTRKLSKVTPIKKKRKKYKARKKKEPDTTVNIELPDIHVHRLSNPQDKWIDLALYLAAFLGAALIFKNV